MKESREQKITRVNLSLIMQTIFVNIFFSELSRQKASSHFNLVEYWAIELQQEANINHTTNIWRNKPSKNSELNK